MEDCWRSRALCKCWHLGNGTRYSYGQWIRNLRLCRLSNSVTNSDFEVWMTFVYYCITPKFTVYERTLVTAGFLVTVFAKCTHRRKKLSHESSLPMFLDCEKQATQNAKSTPCSLCLQSWYSCSWESSAKILFQLHVICECTAVHSALNPFWSLQITFRAFRWLFFKVVSFVDTSPISH